MSRYRKVEVAVWHDERFQALSPAPPNGQTLWLYLLTGPRTTTFPGLIVAREAVMADDLRWSVEAFRSTFQEALREGLVEVDWKAGVVVLTKALLDSTGAPRETSRPDSPNVLRGWARSWDQIPDCELKRTYLRRLGTFAEGCSPSFAEAYRSSFAKALGKPSRNQDQESGDRNRNRKEDSATASQGGFDLPVAPKVGRRKSRPADPTPDERAIAARVLGKLTEHNGIKYSSEDHTKLIVARLRDGISELELRAIVAYCAVEKKWATDKREEMGQYLQPSTLFGPRNIAKYLDPARATYAEQLAKLQHKPQPDEPAQPTLQLVPEAG